MSTISVLTVSGGSMKELNYTFASILSQTVHPDRLVLVASRFNSNERSLIESSLESSGLQYLVVYDQDSSIYNAMNIALSLSGSQYSMFLNAGDAFFANDSLCCIKEDLHSLEDSRVALAYSSVQYFGSDRYLRIPRRTLRCLLRFAVPHQSFVFPSGPDDLLEFNEDDLISADQVWCNQMIAKHGVYISRLPVSLFALGGISNAPSIKYIAMQGRTGRYLKAFYGFPKYLLMRLLGLRRYYRLMAAVNRYSIMP